MNASESTRPAPSHLWGVIGLSAGSAPAAPAGEFTVHCHRRRRGPYTGGGELLRHVVPEFLELAPERVAVRAAEIDAIARDLRPLVPQPPQTLTNTAPTDERTRYYALGRTKRLAHGATELVAEWARGCHPDGVVIHLDEVDSGDPTDIELVATMLRRLDPREVTLVVSLDAVPESQELVQALAAFASPGRVPSRPLVVERTNVDLAQVYVDNDGLDCSPQARADYLALTEDERARRHTRRADLLAARADKVFDLGAICYHRERGLDRPGKGASVINEAIYQCFSLGYYDAALDLAERGRRLVDQDEHPKEWCEFTHKIGASHCYLDRGPEAMPYFDVLRESTTDTVTHMNCSYLIAMLYTRLLPKPQHDQRAAMRYVNAAIAFADALPDPKDRVFFGAFMRNARALVELHRNDIPGALRQVETAMEITDAALRPDQHQLHRSVLRYNRGQVLAVAGDYTGALADYDEAIRRDPEYGDYYFDRATLHRTAGESELALDDYATAIRLTPPFFEAHYNRADLLRDLGQGEEARADFDYALELEPDHLESLLGRADLAIESGDLELAARDIHAAMRIDSTRADVNATHASLLAEQGDVDGAVAAYTAALDQDPSLDAALVNRAVLRYGQGCVLDAIADLDRALELRDDAAIRFNRALALQEIGEHERALADLDAAAHAPDVDASEVRRRRELSLSALAG